MATWQTSLMMIVFFAKNVFPLWSEDIFPMSSFLQGLSWYCQREVSLSSVCLGTADKWAGTEKWPIEKEKAVKSTFGKGFWKGASQTHREGCQRAWACILYRSGSLPLGYPIYFLILPISCSPPCCGPWGCPLPQACQLLQAGRRWEKRRPQYLLPWHPCCKAASSQSSLLLSPSNLLPRSWQPFLYLLGLRGSNRTTCQHHPLFPYTLPTVL